MAVFKCKMCGGDLNIAENVTIAECEYCGTKQTVPTVMDENLQNLFNRANTLRIKSEFDKAEKLYEKIIQADSTQAEAYWGLILCKYGIEYVDDPKTFKRIPTCHRASYDPVVADDDYKAAIENADMSQRALYEEQAKEIDQIQKDILALAQKEETYDVFICYKETDESGKRTIDSTIANDIYYQLKQEGFKVFYAAITLEGKLGSAYEPIIFAALNSAKVMLSIGTKPEYFNSVWVKNEWSRFLKIIKKDRSKLLIPCYRDMDAYELPEEFAHLQAQDMSKIGFINDVVRGIKKIIRKDELKAPSKSAVVGSGTNTSALLKRAFIFLEDRSWFNADDYFEKVLDADPENAMAYLGKMMLELEVTKQDKLAELTTPFDDNGFYKKVIRYADVTLKNTLQGYIETINNRNEHNRLETAYQEAKSTMDSAKEESQYVEAAEKFDLIANYLNSNELASSCRKLAKITHDEHIYKPACSLIYRGQEASDLESKVHFLQKALSKFEEIPEYKDSSDRISKLKLEIEELNQKIEAKRKKAQKIIIIFTAITAFAITFLLILVHVVIPSSKYSSANKCIENKEYDEAISIYEELKLANYKDSAEKVMSTRYLLATSQLESKVYLSAFDNFTLIRDYKDSESKRQESGYLYAQALMAIGEYQYAITYLEEIGDYKKSSDLKKQCYLECAREFYANKEYYDAISWYEKGKPFDKNAEIYLESCYNYGIQQREAGNYQEALIFLEKVENYRDSKEQIKGAKYAYVKENKNYDRYDYSTRSIVFEYLKDLKSSGYEDSSKIYEELYSWKISSVFNNDLLDGKTSEDSISKYDPLFCHVSLSGGTPGEKTKVKYVLTFPDGRTRSGKFEDEWSSGDSGTWYYETGIYVNPDHGQNGMLYVKYYDDNGTQIGKASIMITD